MAQLIQNSPSQYRLAWSKAVNIHIKASASGKIAITRQNWYTSFRLFDEKQKPSLECVTLVKSFQFVCDVTW